MAFSHSTPSSTTVQLLLRVVSDQSLIGSGVASVRRKLARLYASASRLSEGFGCCGSKTTWASWCARTIGGLSNLFIETGIEIRTSFHRHYHRTVKEAVLKSGAMIGYSIRQEHPA